MTNEELAQRIKAGEKNLIEQLWEQTERLLKYIIERELSIGEKAERAEAVGVTREDLYQEGYFALLEAVEAYDPATGFTFAAFLKYPVKNAVNRALGLRTVKDRNDPAARAASLDAPIGNEDSGTLLHFLADPSDPYEDVIERQYQETLHEDLEKSLAELPGSEEKVIRAKYYAGLTLEEIGAREGRSRTRISQLEQRALRHLRESSQLEAYRQEIVERYAYKGGYNRWKNTGKSCVEEAVEKLEAAEAAKKRTYEWVASLVFG